MLYNNARTKCVWVYWASDTSIVVTTWEWALFPTTFPFELTWEHYEWWVVTKREIINVTNIVWDILTITRANQICVQDDSANPKVRSNNAYSFSDGDFISQYVTETEYNAINTAIDTTIPATYATKSEVRNGSLVYAASSTGDDDYEITISGVASYIDWMTYRIKCDVANTWAATLNVNSLWAKSLKKNQWQEDLVDWDILANWIVTATYNSTLDVFQFVWQEATVVSSASNSTVWSWTYWESITAGDPICLLASDGKLYNTDALDSLKQNFVWFALTSWILNDVWTYTSTWIDDNQTGLTTGDDYYLWEYTWTRTDSSTAITNTTSFWNNTTTWFHWQVMSNVWWLLITDVTFSLKKIWSPTDNLQIYIYDSSFNLVATSTTVLDW